MAYYDRQQTSARMTPALDIRQLFLSALQGYAGAAKWPKELSADCHADYDSWQQVGTAAVGEGRAAEGAIDGGGGLRFIQL